MTNGSDSRIEEKKINWKLPLFGAIGFGIGFAIFCTISFTIYASARNSFAHVGIGSAIDISEIMLKGIIVGALGGGAIGLAFEDETRAPYFSFAGAVGFTTALIIMSSVSGLSSRPEKGAMLGAIVGLFLGLAVPKARIATSLLLGLAGSIWFAIAFTIQNNLPSTYGFSTAISLVCSKWDGWGGAIGGTIFGIILALNFKIYDKLQQFSKIPPKTIISRIKNGTTALIKALVNYISSIYRGDFLK